MVDHEPAGMDRPAPVASSPPPAPPPPPPDEAEVLDIAVAVKKKRRPYRHKKFGCTVAEQIMKAVAATKERRGLSVTTMKKLLSASGYSPERNTSRLGRTVKNLAHRGSLLQTAGSGASGSVRPGGNNKPEKAATEGKVAAASFSGARRNRRRRLLVRRPARKALVRPKQAKRFRRTTGRRGRSPAAFRKDARFRKVTKRPTRTTTTTDSTKTPDPSPRHSAERRNGSSLSH
ncbi:histone H1-like [Heterodontus francisci]|uniref:histone H1-like n=1 Tax=Heterodontus francisci TaxID=7792 RepID=UPI00355C3B21